MAHGGPSRSIQPDSAWSWLVACCNCLTGIVSYGMFKSMAVFYRPIMDEFGVEYSDASLITALSATGTAVGALLPLMTRKCGSRLTGIGAGLTLAISTLISSLSPSLIILQIFQGFINGVAAGVLTYIMALTCNEYFDKHKAKAVGIAMLGIPVGGIILPPTLNALIELYGWRGALLIMSAVSLHTCIAASLYRPAVCNHHENGNSLNEPNKDTSEGCVNKPMFHDVSLQPKTATSRKKNWACKLLATYHWRLFRIPAFVAFVISAMFYYPAMVGFGIFLIAFGTETLGVSSFQASLLITLCGVGDCVGKLLFGILGDFEWINRTLLMMLTTLLCGVVSGIMTFFDTYLPVAVFCFIAGVLGSGFLGLNSVVYRDIVGLKELPHALSFHGFLNSLFMFPLIYILGVSLDRTGDARIPFYICSGLYILTAIGLLVVFILEKKKQKTSSGSSILQRDKKDLHSANETLA